MKQENLSVLHIGESDDRACFQTDRWNVERIITNVQLCEICEQRDPLSAEAD